MTTRLHTFERTAPPSSFTPTSVAVPQRKCACGGSAGLNEKCDECSKPNLSLQRSTRNSDHATRNSLSVPPIVPEVLRSSGQQLDRQTRTFMEPRFGHDFSDVRIHTDSQAARSANEVNALAYTVGRHIVFRENQYRPGTEAGDRLLAHELTHTIQQTAGGAGFQGSLAISSPQDAAELEADAVATRVVRGHGATIGQQRSWQIAREQPEAASATTMAPPPVTAATEDAGQKRARIAKELVDKLKAAKATYKQETQRDWDNSTVSDCSKFVQWVLEGAGEGELFGRENARTIAMRGIIAGLTPADQPSFRLTDPKVGDIMMWGGHVGIVYELADQKGTTYLVFAHMGTSGARLLGKSENGFYWLKASDTAKIDEMGSGAFMGFWTPP